MGSRTAIGAATLRAAHQLLDPNPKLLSDNIILKLLDQEICHYILNNKGRFFLPHSIALRRSIVLRSRYTEDCLKDAFQKGIRQYIILGAGLDTFAYRQPSWAKDLHIVEADHPASRKTKLALLEKAEIPLPRNVTYTEVDLENDDLTHVLSAVIHLKEPVFISCLGVLVYLKKSACEKIFRFTGSLAKESEFIFTAKQNTDYNIIAQKAAEVGEPWITHFSQEELRQQLESCNFSAIHFLTAAEIRQLYGNTDLIKTFSPNKSSIVKAKV